MMKVGKDMIQGKTNLRKTDYRDVKYNENGWADARKFLPADYDLMLLVLENGQRVNGWSAGENWEGLKIKPHDKVLLWKNKPGEI